VHAARHDHDAATAVMELVRQAEAVREQVGHTAHVTCCGQWGGVGMRGITADTGCMVVSSWLKIMPAIVPQYQTRDKDRADPAQASLP
jgi:hypothetical protein